MKRPRFTVMSRCVRTPMYSDARARCLRGWARVVNTFGDLPYAFRRSDVAGFADDCGLEYRGYRERERET